MDDGGITIKHHQEAREAGVLKEIYGFPQTGAFKQTQGFYPQRRISHGQFNALVNGIDFVMSETGKIIFK